MGRLRPWTMVFAFVPACVGDDPPLPVCDVNAPFGKPEALSELATSVSKEVDLVLVPGDENTAFFSSVRQGGIPTGGGDSGRDLWTARRPNRARPFETIALVPGVNIAEAAEYRPLLTAGGDTLYLTRGPVDVNGKWTLFRSRKTAGAFGAPDQIVIKHKDRDASPACPWIDPTGGLLYFTELDEPTGPINYIWTIDSSGPPGHIPELDGFQCMVVSDDRTEAFVRKADTTLPDKPEKIFRTDHSQGSSWSPPKPVDELQAPNSLNMVTYVTKNHCDAYLMSTRDGANRIYWARRAPSN